MPLTVVLDVETTGMGPFRGREDGVVQVALAWRDPSDGRVATWSETCDPGRRYYEGGRADDALRLNGTTIEALAAARGAEEVAATLRDRLAALEARHGPLDLRAYNVDFDRRFLSAAPWSLAGPWGPCLMRAAHAALDPRGKWPKLTEACARLGLAYPGPRAHDAAADAHAALLVHEALHRAQGTTPRPA